jgi:hypothetical protein
MTRTNLARLAILGLTALALAGCGSGGGSSGATTAPLRLEDHFGTQFGVDFRNSPNTPATKPAAGDIIPLTLTAPPMPLH